MRNLIRWFNRHFLKNVNKGVWDERDYRNFSARKVLGGVTRADIVEHAFQNCYPTLKDQKSSDFCAGFSSAYAKEATEGRELSPAAMFALGCAILGYVTDWGISILAMMKARVKYGIPEERFWPFTGNREHDANYKLLPQEAILNASTHKDGSFVEIYSVSDMSRFDQIRAYLWKYRDIKAVINTGIDGHAVTLIGQKQHPVTGEMCLFGPDSYGAWNHNYRVGQCIEGYRYFMDSDCNGLFTPYMGIDLPRTLAELLNLYDGKAVKLENFSECYVVSGGKRHLLKNETVAWAFGALLFGEDNVFVLTPEEMNSIPLGDEAKFDDGKNAPVVRRLLEKTNRLDLLDEA